MSDEEKSKAASASSPDDDRVYWLDQPENVTLLIRILIGAAAAVTLADFGYHKHGHFGFQEWFAFDAVFGFAAYVGLVNSAKLLRKVVMRDEDYYEPVIEETSDD